MLMRETDRQRMCVFVYLRGVEIKEREREELELRKLATRRVSVA